MGSILPPDRARSECILTGPHANLLDSVARMCKVYRHPLWTVEDDHVPDRLIGRVAKVSDDDKKRVADRAWAGKARTPGKHDEGSSQDCAESNVSLFHAVATVAFYGTRYVPSSAGAYTCQPAVLLRGAANRDLERTCEARNVTMLRKSN